MKAKFINETLNFERGRKIKTSLDIGRKIRMTLPGGEEIEGPLENEKEAKDLIDGMGKALGETAEYCEKAEIYDDAQMDEMDEVVDEYMEDLKELGYDYTEDWQ